MLLAIEIGRGAISTVFGSICVAVGSLVTVNALLGPATSKFPPWLRAVLDFFEVRGTRSRPARLVAGVFIIAFGTMFILVV